MQNVFALEKQKPNIVIHCDDPQIKIDATLFFEENLRPDSTKRELSNLIKRFYFQWPLKKITVEVMNDKTFEFHIGVRSTVTEFDIQGNRALREAEIVRELKDTQTLYQGDDLKRALSDRVRSYYAYRGFPHVEVKSESIRGKETGTSKIIIKVKENAPCMVSEIEMTGLAKVSWQERIKNEFAWDDNMRCDQEKALARTVQLRSDYNKNFYYQFDLRNPTFSDLKSDGTSAKLSIELTVGNRIAVEFRGNQLSFERSELLRRAIGLDQEKKFTTSFETSSVQSIRDFYETRGYPFAQVRFRRSVDKNLVRLIFDIKRGPIIRLKEVRFEGNRDISQKRLKKQFKAVAPVWTAKKLFIASDLETITSGLLAFYQSLGYLHANFYEPVVDIQKETHSAKIIFKLQEGAPSFFDAFIVRKNVYKSTGEIEKFFRVKKGDPIDPVAMRDAARKLEYDYQIKGFKYAKVQLPELDGITDGYNDYVVNVDEGPRVRIGDIIIRGNYETYQYVVSREVTFKTGDLYNPERFNNTRSRLLRLGFFRSVVIDEKPRDDLQDVEDIVITVSESKKRSVIVRPGVSTDEGVRLTGSYGYTNIGGTGRNAVATGRINHRFDTDSILEHRIIFSYLEPKVLGNFDGKLNLINEQSAQDQFNISTSSIILGIENTTRPHLRPTLQWQLEFRNPFDIEQSANLNPLLNESRARFGALAAILDFDYRDNLLNASKGTFHRLQLSYYDKFLLSDADFWQMYVRNNFYIPIYRRIRTVLSVRAGISSTFGQTKRAAEQSGDPKNNQNAQLIPIEKRFRLGGNSSLRGFSLNCVGGLSAGTPENCADVINAAPGGNSVFNYLFDVLLPITSSVDFVLFTDGGNAFLSNKSLNIFEIRTTAGIGLRYNTIVGPLRVDYGIKLDRRTGDPLKGEQSESFGEFHFAVGQF